MAGKAPAFQLYASDLLVDTLEWDIDEIGIYTRLLSAEWANGDLPEDINRLARIAGCSPKRMQKAWGIVSVKFIQNGKGRLINLRLEETRQKQLEYAESQRERAERRWKKKDAGADASAYAEGVPKPCSSSSSSNKDINKPPLPPKKRGDDYEPDFLVFWNAYPKKAKKPNAYREWKKLGSKRPDIAILTACVEKQRTWRTWIEGYIPDPERWLKNERWLDEPPPTGGNGNGRSNAHITDKRSSLQDEIDAGVAKATAIYEAGKKAARGDPTGVPRNDDAPDFPTG
jgi:uncharacterized protein YdaU (DUF1376 family)